MSSTSEVDTTINLFNNPMVTAARNAMTHEQQEEYKRIGQYMYNSVDYQTREVGPKAKVADTADLVAMSSEALKAGGDPKDLSDEELRALQTTYGQKWYERFDLSLEDIREPIVGINPHELTPEEKIADLRTNQKKFGLSRQYRRFLERKLKKTATKQK